jgi:hypothetical protein
LDNSLPNEEVDLDDVMRDTRNEYNGLAALNPWLRLNSTTFDVEINVYVTNFNDPQVFASTPITYNSTSGLIDYAKIKFNSQIVWKTTTSGYCYSIPAPPNVACTQDARKVANHEMGHAQGLAHESQDVAAVMRQGFLSIYHVKQDDENGIIHIYGAYP